MLTDNVPTFRVPHGHEGASGRLDLEIELGEAALLVVEVKLGAAETADTAKHVGYRQSVEAQYPCFRCIRYVMLVLDAADTDYLGFTPRIWADACIAMQ